MGSLDRSGATLQNPIWARRARCSSTPDFDTSSQRKAAAALVLLKSLAEWPSKKRKVEYLASAASRCAS
eukprot:8592444-Pyramimonas_sp.AAC.1